MLNDEINDEMRGEMTIPNFCQGIAYFGQELPEFAEYGKAPVIKEEEKLQ